MFHLFTRGSIRTSPNFQDSNIMILARQVRPVTTRFSSLSGKASCPKMFQREWTSHAIQTDVKRTQDLMDSAWQQNRGLEYISGIYKSYVKASKPNLSLIKTLLFYSKTAKQTTISLSLWDDVCKYNIPLDGQSFGWFIHAACDAKQGGVQVARELFAKMKNGEYDFNLFEETYCGHLIRAFYNNHSIPDVLEVGRFMIKHDIYLTHSTPYTYLFKACTITLNLELGRQLHNTLTKNGVQLDDYIKTALINFYTKCGKESDWSGLINPSSSDSAKWHISVWTSLVSAYCNAGNLKKAKELLHQMEVKGVEPNIVTWNTLLSAYSKCEDTEGAMWILQQMDKRAFKPSVATWNILATTYWQKGDAKDSMDLFKKMYQAGLRPDLYIWNATIAVCGKCGRLDQMEHMLQWMERDGIEPDAHTWDWVITAYAKHDQLQTAMEFVEKMDQRLKLNVRTWNTILFAYSQAGDLERAMELFHKTKQVCGQAPDVITWNILVEMQARRGNTDMALQLFNQMAKEGVKHDVRSWTALINAHQNLGDRALALLQQMEAEGLKADVVIWTSVISAYAAAGNIEKAVHLLKSMKRSQLEPNAVTWNSIIMGACNAGRPVEEINGLFQQMKNEGIPRDLICWNAVLAAQEQLDTALELFGQMKREGITPVSVTNVAE